MTLLGKSHQRPCRREGLAVTFNPTSQATPGKSQGLVRQHLHLPLIWSIMTTFGDPQLSQIMITSSGRRQDSTTLQRTVGQRDKPNYLPNSVITTSVNQSLLHTSLLSLKHIFSILYSYVFGAVWILRAHVVPNVNTPPYSTIYAYNMLYECPSVVARAK